MDIKDLKDTPKSRDRFVRRNFGGMDIATLRIAKDKELAVLQKFIADVRKEKRKEKNSTPKAK